MRTIMYCLALVAMAGFTSAASPEPTLTSVEAKFDTTTDDKKQDTKLDVYLKNRVGRKSPNPKAMKAFGTNILLTPTKLLSSSRRIPRSQKKSSAVS